MFIPKQERFGENQTLVYFFKRNPKLPIKNKLEILLKLLESINILHQQDMIHGDLRPDYILYNPVNTDSITIINSTVTNKADINNSIILPESIALQHYHAPECHKWHKATYRSDIYSLGKLTEQNITEDNDFLQKLITKMLIPDPFYRINTAYCIREIKQELNKLNSNSERTMTNICEFECLLDYEFKDKNLLKKTLTRKSAVNEGITPPQIYDEENNKRLEYLGDSLLRCVISDLLIELNPLDKEGDLSNKRDQLVSKDNLCEIAKKLELKKFITAGKGEDKMLESRDSILLADIIKTLIGAIFKDSNKNYRELKRIIFKHFDITISSSNSLTPNLIAQDNFKELEDSLNYKFKDKNLLKQALTHSSATNENSNEVLEYLGDSILRCVVSDLQLEEDAISKIEKLNPKRDDLVSNKNKGMLHHTATIRLKLSKFMIVGKSVAHLGDKMLIDAMEALIGAMFIDSGRDYRFIKNFINTQIKSFKEQEKQAFDVNMKLESGFVTKFSPGYDKHRQRQQKNYCFNGLVGAVVMALAATTISQSFNFEKSAIKPKP